MTKQEFLAMSLPYGLKLKGKDGSIALLVDGFEICLGRYSYEWCVRTDLSTPIIRSISDLNKPCVQANYNNGKPFIPIVELAKEYDSGVDWGISEYGDCVDMKKKYVRFILEDNTFYLSEGYDSVGYIDNPFSLYQKLIQFHFWPNMKKSEYVLYVTEEFNPYK